MTLRGAVYSVSVALATAAYLWVVYQIGVWSGLL